MSRYWMAFAFVACLSSELARAETMGEFSFTVPKGWRAELRSFGVYVWAVDPGRSCRAMLISSKGRKVTPQGEFDSAWREYVIPDGVVGPTAITQAERTGWVITTGAIKTARGNWRLLLSTRTGQDRTYSVKVYMGDESCPREAGTLMDSLALVSAAGPLVLMTNVKDGWKTTAHAEFVQVTKGETEARLLYPDVWLEANRPNSAEPTEYYWKRKVAPFFKTWQVRQSTEFGDPAIYYREAKSIETHTGRTCFIAMKLVFSGGTWPVVVVAPSEAAFRQQFPRPKDLDRLLEHNGFAVTAKGLEGEWRGKTEGWFGDSTNGTKELGITLSGDGTYKGRLVVETTTSEGVKKSSNDGVEGTYTLTGSEITAANWAAGKSKRFRARLAVIKHGRQLTLTELDDPSSEYVLLRSW